MAVADLHGERAGSGPTAGRLQPHRARGRRPGQRGVRPPVPDGGPGRHRHARPHQQPGLGRGRDARGVPNRFAGARRRAHHQRPLQDGGPTPRRDRSRAGLAHARRRRRAPADRPVRVHHPPHRRWRLRHRRRRERLLRGGLVDPDLQADARRRRRGLRAQSRRLEVHPLQRPPARPHGWRPPRPDGLGRGRGPAAGHAVRRPRPRRHRGSGRRDHRAVRGGHPGHHLRTRRGHLRRIGRAGPGRRQSSRHRLLYDGGSRRRRDNRRLRGVQRRQPVGHQRGPQLHPRLHHLHGALGAEPRHPQQPRQPGAHQDAGPGGVGGARRVPAAGHGPPCGGHVPAQRAAQGPWPR